MYALFASMSLHQTLTWSRRRTPTPRVDIRCGWFFRVGTWSPDGLVVLALVVDRHAVPVGIGEPVGAAVPGDAGSTNPLLGRTPRRPRRAARAPRRSSCATRSSRRPGGPRPSAGATRARSRPTRAGRRSRPTRSTSSMPRTSMKKPTLADRSGVRQLHPAEVRDVVDGLRHDASGCDVDGLVGQRLDARDAPRVRDGHRADLLVREAGGEKRVGHQREPVLDRRIRALAEIRRPHRAAPARRRASPRRRAPTRPCPCRAS